MRRKLALIAVVLLFVAGLPGLQGQVAVPAVAATPVNPHASPEARALLKYLQSISGHYTLTGQHNFPNHIARWTDRAYDLTGKYPALFGQDFGFAGEEDKDSVLARPELIEEAKRQYRNGAVVTLTWHAVRPTSDEPVTFRDNVQSHLSGFEWNELLTPGTRLYNRWCEQVDVVAGYLKQLQEARVPVLFRPYHEMNGPWFWWGGRPGKIGSSALYRQIFDRFVNVHHLDNLIWVWNVNATNSPSVGAMADYFPGPQYADLLSVDTYGEFKQSYYDEVLALAGGKPIALGEVGAAPTPELLRQQPKWIYFMVWSEFVEWDNSLQNLRTTFNASNLLTRDDPRFSEPMAAIRKASFPSLPEPVSPTPTAGAKSLLGRLHSVSGKNVLTGQENTISALSGATDHVFEVTAKYPLIYGADLGITQESGLDLKTARQAVVDEAKRQHQNHSIVCLTWRAARPTDDEPASSDQMARGLSDFEWNELLTPGTNLYKRWSAQVDAVAASLKQLQDAGVPVLWQPYPEPNGKRFWWAGRKGNRGSSALYRQLFNRMVNTNGLHNLVWVWNAAAAEFGFEAPGLYNDFFPGLLYVDALAIDLDDASNGWRIDSSLKLFATGKIIGLGLTGKIPSPDLFTRQPDWTWFLASPDSTAAPEKSEALQSLYSDPRLISRASETPPSSSLPPK